jgi:type I restriction enzyme S subunit
MMEEEIIPDGYKQTEMGIIPSDWNILELDELGSANQPAIKAGPFGSALTKDIYVKEGFKIYGQEQVISGDYNFGNYYVDDTKFRQLKSCEVIEGDILLSLVGTTGKLLVIPKDAERGIINPRLLRFRFDKLMVNSIYFKNLFESNLIQNYLSTSAQGGTMAVLNAGILKRLVIPLPALKEQTAIANALSDVDTLIASIEKLIAKKQAIKTATMQQLLTGKKRLPPFDRYQSDITKGKSEGARKGQLKGTQHTELGEIPEDWEFKPLSELTTLMTNGFVGTAKTHYTESDGGVTYIQGYNVKENAFNYRGIKKVTQEFHRRQSKSCLREGDVLMVQTGDVGLTTIVPLSLEGANCHALIISRFKKKKFNPMFFSYYLNSKEGRNRLIELEVGTTMKHINVGDLQHFHVPVPSLIQEQIAISNILTDMNVDIDSLTERLSKTQQIKQGMMQELLTGKTRLI